MTRSEVYKTMLDGYKDLSDKFPSDHTYLSMLDTLLTRGEDIIPDDPFVLEVLSRIWAQSRSNFWSDSLMRTATFDNMSSPPSYVNDDEVIVVARWGNRAQLGSVPMSFINLPDGGWVSQTGESVTLEAPPEF